MKIDKTTDLSPQQKQQIVTIWNAEYPRELAHPDLESFDRYLANLADRHHLLLTNEAENVKGWLMYFIRDNERFFAMLLDASVHGQGLGSQLLDAAKSYNNELVGWVIDHDRLLKQNGDRYRSPVDFYRKNGFEILPHIQLNNQKIGGIKIRWTNE